MQFDVTTIAVMALSILILGLSKGGFAGIGMVSMPVLSLVLPPSTAAGIILPVLILQDAISVVAYRRSFDSFNLKVMLPGAVVGVLVGALMVSVVNRAMFELVLGIISVVFGLERIVRQFTRPPKAHWPNRYVGMVCGALAGFTSMIAHAGVPPFQFFVLPQRLPRDIFIGTSVMFYAATNLVKLPFFLSLGQITRQSFLISLAMFPVAFMSVLLGIWLVRRIPTEKFIMLANVILVGIGIMLVGRGLAG